MIFVFLKLLGGTVLGGFTMFAMVDFKSTITLGSVLLGLLVVIAAGFFAVRGQQIAVAARAAESWRTEAEAAEAKADRLGEELREKIGEFGVLQRDHEAAMAAFSAEQREIRHALKAELAAAQAALEVERAKHDLGALIERMQALHSEAMANFARGEESLRELLVDIRDTLKEG